MKLTKIFNHPATLIGGASIAFVLACLFPVFMEAHTYEKLTGTPTTTWDALWIELRVDCK